MLVREGKGMTSNRERIEALLAPESLLFLRRDLDDVDPELLEALRQRMLSSGNVDERIDNVHYVVALLHEARQKDEARFLTDVFLPWVALRRRTEHHRRRIQAELARLDQFRPGSTEDAMHMVNIYRSIVADLFDPHVSLLLACHQFLEGSFDGIQAANLGMGERGKVEYLEKRVRKAQQGVRIFDGYSAVVRNAVSHPGSEGVVYESGAVLFRNIKRGNPPQVETERWSHDALYERTLSLLECIKSIEIATEIFGFDCQDRFVHDFESLAALLTLAFSPEQRRSLRAIADARLAAIRTDEALNFDERFEILSKFLFVNCGLRGLAIDRATYRARDKLVVLDIPPAQTSAGPDTVLDRVMGLIRFAILARSIYGDLFDLYVVREAVPEQPANLTVSLTGAPLDEYADERAGLVDLLSEAHIRLAGERVLIEIDSAALEKAEDESVLPESFPRRGKPISS